MTLSRSNLYNNPSPCMPNFTNTTLNSTFFTQTPDNQNVTFFYGCYALNSSSYEPPNLFTCNNSGAYYVVGPVPVDPVFNVINCGVSVVVPMLKSAADELVRNRTLLGQVLMEGFNVNYSIPYGDECSECLDSGGECGWFSGRPVCICGDRICDSTEKEVEQFLALSLGLAIAGAVLAGIGIGMLILRLRQRKKKIADQTQSRDLPTPPSSKGAPPSSTTNLSQSTPSYSTSRSYHHDIEKGSTYFGAHVFSYEELEEATECFNPSKELGEGGFGTVYYGVLRDGRVVAVKRLYESNFKRVEQYMNEIEILTRIRHPNLVTLYGCTSRRSRELLLVYEYIPNGTVADHLHGKMSNSGLLPWPVRLNIAVESARALAYLHASDIIHRDVKTNNILLDKNFHLTEKSDVYSFGVVLIELISSKQAVDTNRHRYDINLANMAISRIQNHALHELIDPSLGFESDYAVKTTMTAVSALAFRCLQQDREMRPSMEEVLQALEAIQNKELGAEKAEVVDIITSEAAEVVDIRSDDVGLLKHIPPPLSPDSVNEKWVSSSTIDTTPHRVNEKWCAVAGSPGRSPTTSPVVHLRRRKTLRMLLNRSSTTERRRFYRRHDDNSFDPPPQPPPPPPPTVPSATSTAENKKNSNGKKSRRKLKELFVASPPFEERESNNNNKSCAEETVDLLPGTASSGDGFSSRGSGSLRPITASFRYRLLRRAWRPMLVTIPE
ncbi:hypothetical protein CCACVL1_13095 [Corchorus capsularis]|uniref:Protein kinase domain-containing protein n=1 Tax=Corchorus capsularis TaxID=210143 RepID=A0A1R3ICE1_COCAP|nr:hypothetical protein CCACVL1_13095 [Corchorus capsularis]